MENWKSVVGFEGIYEVSDLGNIRRIGKAMGSKVGRVLKPYQMSNGYLQVDLQNRGITKAYVHRVVLAAFIGPSPLETNHKNGIKSDNRLQNLEYVTSSANLMHATRVLRKRSGAKHWNATLTEESVRLIHKLRAEGWQHDVIAASVGVHRVTVTNVLCGKTWGYLHPTRESST